VTVLSRGCGDHTRSFDACLDRCGVCDRRLLRELPHFVESAHALDHAIVAMNAGGVALVGVAACFSRRDVATLNRGSRVRDQA
jgi:hypothetical protein